MSNTSSEPRNAERELAQKIIEHTHTNLFLTGRAGTGKTTFLRQFREKTNKRMVVLAPTGIAAINAGGVTIHSFLQLPFGMYIPGSKFSNEQFRFSARKRKLIRSLDLIVIDEISMVRADLLDCMDAALRRLRTDSRPFGGVQLLMIGDLQQLPPVVRDDERATLLQHYDSEFFFSSHALKQTPFTTVELQQVYRQTDMNFLELLNAVRDNRADARVLQQLNARFVPNFVASGATYVRLVTHNHQADQINAEEMAHLSATEHDFVATVEGTFPESSYPAAERLTLKRGAQVMFIKNDSSPEHRYFNGLLGEITSISVKTVTVRPNDGGDEIEVAQEAWQNSRFTLNEKTNEIEEVVEGTFKQIPLRLAWAITVHKSQGLTFEHAIIDVQSAFSHGQAYVALSRCKTLEGMVLSAPIPAAAIIQDVAVAHFSHAMAQQVPDAQQVEQMERSYYFVLMVELFDFAQLLILFDVLVRIYQEHYYKRLPATVQDCQNNRLLLKQKVVDVAQKFRPQFETLIAQHDDYAENEFLAERVQKGARYFLKEIKSLETFMRQLIVPTENKTVGTRLKNTVKEIRELLHLKHRLLADVSLGGFDVTRYQQVRAVASIEDVDAPAPRRRKKTEPKD